MGPAFGRALRLLDPGRSSVGGLEQENVASVAREAVGIAKQTLGGDTVGVHAAAQLPNHRRTECASAARRDGLRRAGRAYQTN